MDERSRCLPELVQLGGLFLGQDLRVQGERRRTRQFTLLLVFPGLQGVLKCLGHENPELHFLLLSEVSTCLLTADVSDIQQGHRKGDRLPPQWGRETVLGIIVLLA